MCMRHISDRVHVKRLPEYHAFKRDIENRAAILQSAINEINNHAAQRPRTNRKIVPAAAKAAGEKARRAREEARREEARRTARAEAEKMQGAEIHQQCVRHVGSDRVHVKLLPEYDAFKRDMENRAAILQSVVNQINIYAAQMPPTDRKIVQAKKNVHVEKWWANMEEARRKAEEEDGRKRREI